MQMELQAQSGTWFMSNKREQRGKTEKEKLDCSTFLFLLHQLTISLVISFICSISVIVNKLSLFRFI